MDKPPGDDKLKQLLDEQRKLGEDLHRFSVRHAELTDKIAQLEKLTQRTETSKETSTPPPLPNQRVNQPPATVSKQKDSPPKAAPIASTASVKPNKQTKPNPTTHTQPSKPQPTATAAKKPEPADSGEWELTFGRIWLVRIGVLLLLTGLIFLSTYAYKNWLFNTGAGVKVAFFMTISIALSATGLWLEHRRERFRQYGRVLASGGLAAGYYTVYAAHFVPSLKILTSPALAATLLTLWAGIILAYAVWKKSRIVAVMAIGLAFYGTIVNPAGWISLFSALLLSASGIWLMLRFRWISIGLGTIAAAYASHVFWLEWFPGDVSENVRLGYLASYWLLFTVAMMTAQARKLTTSIHRSAVAINNGAAWCLTVFTLPSFIPHQKIGWISLGIGTFWLLLAFILKQVKRDDQSLAVIFGYQGLLIATLGILIEATGYSRFLVLAVEACILLAGARHFGGVLARIASAGSFTAALITAGPNIAGGTTASWQAYGALALLCAVYTVLVKREQKDTEQPAIAIIPAGITWLVLGVGVLYQWQPEIGMNGLWLCILAVLLGYQYSPKLRSFPGVLELAVVATPVAIIACWWYIDLHTHLQIWQSILPLVGTITVWWLCPKLLNMWKTYSHTSDKPNTILEWVFSVIFWIMLGSTSTIHMSDEAYWLALGGVLAITGHAITQWSGRTSIGGPALVFHLSAIGAGLTWGAAYPALAWLPATFLLLHMVLVDYRWKLLGDRMMLGLLALALSSAVAIQAFQELNRPDLLLTLLALCMAIWAYTRRQSLLMLNGCVVPLLLAGVTALLMHAKTDWLRYIPILVTLLCHGFLWCKTKDETTWKLCRVLLLVAGLVSLALASSIHVLNVFQGSGLAICWSLLASLVFCAGLAIQCRPYRLIGLWWLTAAVLHVICIDVMRLETLGRILSFITLGLVLLALGFLYNKFQETIRKFL